MGQRRPQFLGVPFPGGVGDRCVHTVSPRDGFEQDVEGSSGLTGTCAGEETSGDVGSWGDADGIKGGRWGQWEM